MKKALKFVYWFAMVILFLALVYRAQKIDQLNQVDVNDKMSGK